jgi:diguanylate cyclase (GGDEF)-like protein
MTKSQKILVVDASRVVRAMLARCAGKTHAVCEESDGESAWQSLVLDASIVAVISGLDITGVDGAGLVERMRASKLARINDMPFFLLASDSFLEAGRQRARRLGVTGFIPKAAPAEAILHLFAGSLHSHAAQKECAPEPRPGGAEDGGVATEIGTPSDIGLSDLSSRMGRLVGLDEAFGGKGTADTRDGDEEYERRLAERTATRCLELRLSDAPATPMVSVLIFGIDGYAELCERFGQKTAEKVVGKFSALLAGKIRAEENVLHLTDGRIGIVSTNVDREQCTSFAKRVCKALAAATIWLGGKQVKATVSAGVAAVPQDGSALSAEALLYLASSRLEAAFAAGGNQVAFASVVSGNNLHQEEFIARLKALLTTSSPAVAMSCKSWLHSVCIACRQSRPEGELSPCSASLASGLCGNRKIADS